MGQSNKSLQGIGDDEGDIAGALDVCAYTKFFFLYGKHINK